MSLNDFSNWNKPDEILKNCNLLHLPRKNKLLNQDLKKITANDDFLEDGCLSGKVYQLSVDITTISSTQIRNNLEQYFKDGKNKDIFNQLLNLIDQKTLNYLIKHFKGLYYESS